MTHQRYDNDIYLSDHEINEKSNTNQNICINCTPIYELNYQNKNKTKIGVCNAYSHTKGYVDYVQILFRNNDGNYTCEKCKNLQQC